jgi:hypothetical protein
MDKMEPGFRHAMAVDMKPGAKLYRGSVSGSNIEKDPITITTVDGQTASYTGTTGKDRKGTFTADDAGVAMKFANGYTALYVNEVEAKYGPTHGLGRRRKTRRRRHHRKTRRSRK